MRVRAAEAADAAGILAIYAPFVQGTAVSFELEPPTVEEMAARVATTLRSHPWLVAVEEGDGGRGDGARGASGGGDILGYAYAGSFRTRAAYRWSTEVTAYVREDVRGTGVGRALYGALLDELAERGFVTALAGIALPNPASVAFHEAFGFEPVGVFRNVGFKLGRWWDVGWWQRPLRDPLAGPAELR